MMRLWWATAASRVWTSFSVEQGLLRKRKDAALIDGLDGGGLVEVAGEHDADDVGGEFAGFGQELDAAHFGHAHVGDDDGVVAPVLQGGQARDGAGGGFDCKQLVELALDGGEDVGFVVHE